MVIGEKVHASLLVWADYHTISDGGVFTQVLPMPNKLVNQGWKEKLKMTMVLNIRLIDG